MALKRQTTQVNMTSIPEGSLSTQQTEKHRGGLRIQQALIWTPTPFLCHFLGPAHPSGFASPLPVISRWQHPQISMLSYSHPRLSDHGLTLDWWGTPGPTQGPGGGHALRPGSPDLPSTVPAVLGTWTGVDSTTQAAEWWGGTHTSLPVQGESGCLMLDFSHDTFGIHHFKKMRRKTTTGSFPSPNTPRKKNMLDTYLLGARPWTRCWKRNVKGQTPWPWGSLGVPPLLSPAPASASRSHEKTVKDEGAAWAAVGRVYSASSVGPASRLWTDWFPRPWRRQEPGGCSPSQNPHPGVSSSHPWKADVSHRGLGKEGNSLVWKDHSLQPASDGPPTQWPLLLKALAFSKVWEKVPRKVQDQLPSGPRLSFHVVKKPLGEVLCVSLGLQS